MTNAKCFTGLVMLLAMLPTQAHHSVFAQFDLEKDLQMTGVLIKIEWLNPHGWLHFDIKQADGKVARWALETPPPAGWRRLGLASKGYFVAGQTFQSRGAPARHAAENADAILALLTELTFPDGRKVSVLGAQTATP